MVNFEILSRQYLKIVFIYKDKRLKIHLIKYILVHKLEIIFCFYEQITITEFI